MNGPPEPCHFWEAGPAAYRRLARRGGSLPLAGPGARGSGPSAECFVRKPPRPEGLSKVPPFFHPWDLAHKAGRQVAGPERWLCGGLAGDRRALKVFWRCQREAKARPRVLSPMATARSVTYGLRQLEAG